MSHISGFSPAVQFLFKEGALSRVSSPCPKLPLACCGRERKLETNSSRGVNACQELFRGRYVFLQICLLICKDFSVFWTSLVAQMVKCLPPMRETHFQSLGRKDLEKDMATHSSSLAWKIPWMEEPGRLQSMGSQRVVRD